MTRPSFSLAEADVVGAIKRYDFLLIILPAVVVAVLVGFVVHKTIVHDSARIFADGMSCLVSNVYDADTFGVQDSSEQYAQISQLIDGRLGNGQLTGFRLVTNDGTVVYSTVDEETGTQVVIDDALRAAFERGEFTSSVVSDDPLDETGEINVLIVGPIRFSGDDRPAGAVQFLKPYSLVSPIIRSSVITVTITIIGGAFIAYLLLRLLIVRLEKQIQVSEKMVERVNDRLGSSLNEMERHFLGTLQTLTAAVDAKDRYTALHSLHVADYACVLGGKLEMYDQLVSLERAGLLHDVGKIGVAEDLLQKPGSLTPDEYEQVMEHSRIGATMVETIPFLYEVIPAIMHHHERWDGTGYPSGLSGETIPVLARVLAVADAFDAMTTDRPYTTAMSVTDARAELVAGRGSQFDPMLVDVFVGLIDDGIIIVRSARAVAAV